MDDLINESKINCTRYYDKQNSMCNLHDTMFTPSFDQCLVQLVVYSYASCKLLIKLNIVLYQVVYHGFHVKPAKTHARLRI
jgi:hypothetical protein